MVEKLENFNQNSLTFPYTHQVGIGKVTSDFCVAFRMFFSFGKKRRHKNREIRLVLVTAIAVAKTFDYVGKFLHCALLRAKIIIIKRARARVNARTRTQIGDF